jgi:hypothetical protein
MPRWMRQLLLLKEIMRSSIIDPYIMLFEKGSFILDNSPFSIYNSVFFLRRAITR